MTQLSDVPAGGSIGVRMRRGERLRIVDIEGGQSGDLMVYSADGRERLSNGRSFDYNGKINLTTGDILWSDASRPMLTIIGDDTGRHDFLYVSCSTEMYRLQYGLDDHPNCVDNLGRALRDLGIEPGPLPTAFNVFMVTEVASDGTLSVLPPKSVPGSSIEFRAEMDLAVAISACPASTCNGGAPPHRMAFEILPSLPD